MGYHQKAISERLAKETPKYHIEPFSVNDKP